MNAHTSQILKLERHAYAPELNTIHLTNGDTIPAHGLQNIGDCKTLLRSEARKQEPRTYFLTAQPNAEGKHKFISHTTRARYGLAQRLDLYKQMKSELETAPARTFFHGRGIPRTGNN